MKYLCVLLGIILSNAYCHGQNSFRGTYNPSLPIQEPYYHNNTQVASRTSGQNGTGANIDVVYARCEWFIDPDLTKAISGAVTYYFKTTVGASVISFDLNKAAFNNSSLIVEYHGSTAGVTKSFPTSGYLNALSIGLPVTLPANTLDSVKINYGGNPPASSGEAIGYVKGSSATNNNNIYTLSESFEDKDWWPCKADMQDKIDSMDFIITTPSAFTPVVNGKLVSTVTSGANKIYTYKHRYPITTYLVAVGVAKYTYFPRPPVNINGTMVPVEYYIYTSRGASAAKLTAMDFCRDELLAFSEKFGDYPFKNEKYGMYEFMWGGGMEHQTNSAMSYGSMGSWGTIAHELAHQWFGDKVTFATWNHLWLAEGFARYMEALAAETVPGLGQNPSTVRSGFKTTATNTTNRAYSCYVPNATIANSDLLWGSAYGTTVYERGAMVVSMLRTLMGDTKFFQACRNYLDDPALAYKSATTTDLKNHLEAQLAGFDLTDFFNSWVYGGGFPTTQINWWNPSGNILNLAVGSQTRTSAGTTAYFANVIPVRVQGAGGEDTLIIIYDNDGNNLAKAGNGVGSLRSGNGLSFQLSFKPTIVTFDTYNMTLSSGSTLKTTVLDLKVTDFMVNVNGFSNEAYLTLDNNSIGAEIILERSADAISFHNIGVMSPLIGNKYFLKDEKPLNGFNYYRAKFKDAEGAKIYSKIVKISNAGTGKSTYTIVNNPVTNGKLEILTNQLLEASINVLVYDAAGKLMITERLLGTGQKAFLNTSRLISGTYILVIEGEEKQPARFIIK